MTEATFTPDRTIGPTGRASFAALVAVAALLFLPGLGLRDLWGPDEPRVAGVGAEMARTGDFVVPRLNGRPFLEQPPLYYAILASSVRLLGENAFAFRLPSALAAIGSVLLVFALARRMRYSPVAAFASAFVLAVTPQFWNIGRRCVVDMTLCLFTTGAMVCLFEAVRRVPRRLPWWIGLSACLAGAVATKSLVGLAVPLCAAGAWLVLERRFDLATWAKLAAASLVSLAPVAVWLLFLHRELGGSAVYEIVWMQNFGRFSGEQGSHRSPLFYYFGEFPKKFLPWTFFLPAAVLEHRRRRRDPAAHPGFGFALAWFVAPFLLLSLASGKRSLYLLPLYPAAALYVGPALGSLVDRRGEAGRWLRIPLLLLGVAPLAAAVGFFIFARRENAPPLAAVAASLLVLAAGLPALRAIARRCGSAALARAVVPAIVVGLVVFDAFTLPLLNARESYVPLFRFLRAGEEEAGGERPIALYRPSERVRGAAYLYLGRTLPEIWEGGDAEAFLASDPRAWIVIREDVAEGFPAADSVAVFSIDRRRMRVMAPPEHPLPPGIPREG